MDTSTLSFTPAEDKPLPSTSSPLKQLPRPGEAAQSEWFSRFISPLTGTGSSPDSSPVSTPVLLPAQLPMHENFPGTDMPPRTGTDGDAGRGVSTVLLIVIPVMVVVLTVLLGLIVFLVAVLYMRKKRGIRLTEDGGPLDLSKSDGVIGEGGPEGVEARWLETVEPDVREAYRRAKGSSAARCPVV